MTRERDIAAWRGIALILACFAVSLRLVIPLGFMPGITAEGRAGLVLCAPTASTHKSTDPTQAPQDQQQHCVFAGSAVGPVEDQALAARVETFTYAPVAFAAWRDLAPGRGLPAPPPPAIGPPLRDV